jgi:c-di-GMP-binding flagellar brake protein YcgR
MARERRRFSRADQPFETRYRLLGELMHGWCAARTLNISAGGIRFRSEEPLERGSMLEIQLKLPSHAEVLVLQGRVSWSKTQASGVTEIGVELLDVTPDQQAQIDAVVQFLS